MKRRDFILKTSLGTAAVLFSSSLIAAEKSKPKKIGLQLYTLRDAMKDDFMGTLSKVAVMGYTWIELAGYKQGTFYEKKPSEIKKIISDFGMELISSHAMIELSEAKQAIDAHAEAGIKYMVIPYLKEEERKTIDDYRKLSNNLNTIGDIAKQNGLKLAYHNHAFELEKIEEQIPYDIMLMNTDNNLVCYEMDLYWVIKSGSNPVDLFQKYPDRFELFHVKDMDNSADRNFTEVGNGTIDFKPIFENKKLAGMKYFFVEQDKCLNHASIESIKISIDYINKTNYIK